MHATLDEFLDRQRSGLASTYLTRLKVGQRLVDATAVPVLYSGRVRPRHVFLVLLLACSPSPSPSPSPRSARGGPVDRETARAARQRLRGGLT